VAPFSINNIPMFIRVNGPIADVTDPMATGHEFLLFINGYN